MNVLDYLKEHFLILDGGTGTVLQAAGLKSGERPETWNLSRPEQVVVLHRGYYEAGSNIVATNTFGVNLFHYSEEEAGALIRAAVSLAKRAADGIAHPTWVALDVGPSGKLLRPLGDLDFEEAVRCYAFLARTGQAAGADLILIETMNDSQETRAALLGAREGCGLPVFVSNAYSENGHLLTGASPEVMTAILEGMGADVIGANCSFGPAELAPVVREYLRHASVPLLLKANAGLPRVENGATVYDITPEEFAETEAGLAAEGVRVLGGCCGTTPAHIRALSRRLAAMTPAPLPVHAETTVTSGSQAVSFGGVPLLIGERINPTGKKRLRQALTEGDWGYVLEQATMQEEKGVHLLDVNVGVPGLDEAAVLPGLIGELQAVTALPLQIDTASPEAMEAALRIYNGKALINSVNGKRESMDAIFPLVKKYGGVVVALTLDEGGIPDTVEGRMVIARRILEEARRYGLGEKDLVFDTLTMTISAAPEAAEVTLRSLERIRTELGCHTSLGVSNVSFGLPDREGINSAFFALAIERGLSAAIMNPFSDAMMKTWRACNALRRLDPNCGEWIRRAAAEKPAGAASAVSPAPAASPTAPEAVSTLSRAVVKGFRRRAAELTQEGLREREGMALIQEEIIPALNEVGRAFEKQTLFLPQLLMSAEAAAAAFEVIRAASGKAGSVRPRGKIVLATVHGDVHDIGKNIVRLLLENYGFEVIDLGRDVPAETVLEAVLREKAPLVGLSALMTTTVPAMEETIRLIHERAPGVRVLVGGAVLTPEYARQIGADGYGADAMDAVRYALSCQGE